MYKNKNKQYNSIKYIQLITHDQIIHKLFTGSTFYFVWFYPFPCYLPQRLAPPSAQYHKNIQEVESPTSGDLEEANPRASPWAVRGPRQPSHPPFKGTCSRLPTTPTNHRDTRGSHQSAHHQPGDPNQLSIPGTWRWVCLPFGYKKV